MFGNLRSEEEYVLTFHGRLVHVEKERGLLRCPCSEDEMVNLVPCTRRLFEQITRFSFEEGIHGDLGNFRLRDLYASCLPDGTIELNRVIAMQWETFKIIEGEHLQALDEVTCRTWFSAKTGELISPTLVSIAEDFQLVLNNRFYDLSGRMPELQRRDNNIAQTILYENRWVPCKLMEWRTRIYYSAFGIDKSFQMLGLSLQSLEKYADYAGEIMVMTDRSPKQVIEHIPAGLRQYTIIWQTKLPRDVGYHSARYLVKDWTPSNDYHPIMYVDTDVVFDGPLLPALLAVAASDKICVQGENWHALKAIDSVGAFLLRETGEDVGEEYGFNSGVIGFPTMRHAREPFEMLLDAIQRFQRNAGRKLTSWYDQPIFNYVAFVYDLCDKIILQRHVRYGKLGDLRGGPLGGGMVHLWNTVRKVEEMQSFLGGRTE